MLNIYIAILGVMSPIAFILYGIDKMQAQRDGGRIPEITLLTVTALGGAAGAFFARLTFRHKRIFRTKFHFTITIYASLFWEALGVLALIFWL